MSDGQVPGTAATAAEVACALLGPGPLILHASFTGPPTGLTKGAAVWDMAGGAGPSWLDIDLVPGEAPVTVALTLTGDDPALVAAAVERGQTPGRRRRRRPRRCARPRPPPRRWRWCCGCRCGFRRARSRRYASGSTIWAGSGGCG